MISYILYIEYCNIYAKLSTIITYYYHNIYNNERNITYAYILLSYIIYGTSQFTDKVTFSPTFRPGFFAFVRFIRLLIGGELDHFQKS